MNSSNASDHNMAYKDDDGKSQNIDTMLDFNALSYDMSPDLSVVTDRTFKNHPFQKGEYTTGDTAFCILNSGADFIDARNSYLAFDLLPTIDISKMTVGSPPPTMISQIDSEQQPEFNSLGSVMDLIQDITITDRAGNEVERVQDVGRLANVLCRSTYAPDWFATYGAQLGFRKSTGNAFTANQYTTSTFPGVIPHAENFDNLGLAGTESTSPGIKRGCSIPMRFLSGLFDFDQLLPAHLMSGLRIEIRFARKADAFQIVNKTTEQEDLANALTWQIVNPRFVLDSVKLTDSISRELNERAANNGLEIPFRTWWTTKYVSGQATKYNVEVRKAVSRAFRAVAHFQADTVRGAANVPATPNVFDTDQNQTSAFSFKEWQWRAGNLYFPHQRMQGSFDIGSLSNDAAFPGAAIGSGASETYMQYQRLFGKNHEKFSENDLHPDMYGGTGKETSLNQYTARSANYDYTNSVEIPPVAPYALIPLDLERSTVQDLSGIPLNNSRILSLNFELQAAAAGTVTVWMQHLKVARVFMDNTEIEE